MKSQITKDFNTLEDGTISFGAKEYPNWYGIEDIGFIYHNAWADPEIEYKKHILNSHIIEDTMWENYEYCKNENGLDVSFEQYMLDNKDVVYECLDEAINQMDLEIKKTHPDILFYKDELSKENMQVKIDIDFYSHNNLSISLLSKDEYLQCFDYYAPVTVNLGTKLKPYQAYLDIENNPSISQFLEENNIAQPLNKYISKGNYDFPLYKFNKDKLKELCPDGIIEYENAIKQKHIEKE